MYKTTTAADEINIDIPVTASVNGMEGAVCIPPTAMGQQHASVAALLCLLCFAGAIFSFCELQSRTESGIGIP